MRTFTKKNWMKGDIFISSQNQQNSTTGELLGFTPQTFILDLCDTPIMTTILTKGIIWAPSNATLCNQSTRTTGNTWPRGLHITNLGTSRPMPDHFHIFIVNDGLRFGISSFRFENMCLKEEGFSALIRCWWNNYHFKGAKFHF